ncbi:hypothetical protein [Streptomyces sp. NPDC004050]
MAALDRALGGALDAATGGPAQRREAGSPRKGQTARAGIPVLQGGEHVKYARRTTSRSSWSRRSGRPGGSG